MQFEPLGGFPPIVRIDDVKPVENNLGTRGFASTNIVSINNIMNSKKKGNLFIAFDNAEEEGGYDLMSDTLLYEKPIEFSGINYKEMPKRLKKKTRVGG
jgi:hypothetical protein